MRARAAEETGITLVELAITCLLVGIMAAFALSLVGGQRERAQDVVAKSDARNTLTSMESCVVGQTDFRACAQTPGNGSARVAVLAADRYDISARSGSRRDFNIRRDTAGARQDCTPDGGGCHRGRW